MNRRADLRLRPVWKSVNRRSKVEMAILVESIICDYDSIDVWDCDNMIVWTWDTPFSFGKRVR
jgi:hypothetical protein